MFQRTYTVPTYLYVNVCICWYGIQQEGEYECVRAWLSKVKPRRRRKRDEREEVFIVEGSLRLGSLGFISVITLRRSLLKSERASLGSPLHESGRMGERPVKKKKKS